MKYSIEYQVIHAGMSRPSDDGQIAGISFESNDGSGLIPDVGDFVSFENNAPRAAAAGIVKTRYFRYTRVGEELYCEINIVLIDENKVVWDELIKE
ncbi:TPA: hypothetical protein ACY2HE_004268 [Yersinia enterocolitica]